MSSTSNLVGGQGTWLRRRPLLRSAVFTDLQNGSYLAAIYSLVESLLIIAVSVFEIYVLCEAQPGTTHYRYYGINFLFVYSGNLHVRNLLIACAIIFFLFAIYLIVCSTILMRALRKEHERKFHHWLTAMSIMTGWSTLSIIFRSIANDLYFAYHQAMLGVWILLIIANVFFILVVYSNYQELQDITRLEDMARLKMGTMSSLSTTSRSLSHYSVDFKNSHSFSSTPRGTCTAEL